jgi:DNA-binding NarL/FixJ family response regulator
MTAPIRLLLVDDHPIVREGLANLLGSSGELEVAAQAGTLEEALSCADLPIDVCVLDIALPDGDGLSAIPTIRRTWPGIGVLVLSMQPERPYAARSIEAGALGYVAKGAAPSELQRAIRAVASGRRYLSDYAREVLSQREAEVDATGLLSPRELEVLRRLSGGESVSDIARGLGISVKTVSTFKSRIHEKLGLASIADLVRFADHSGISGAPSASVAEDD